jgi:hypothetical protein
VTSGAVKLQMPCDGGNAQSAMLRKQFHHLQPFSKRVDEKVFSFGRLCPLFGNRDRWHLRDPFDRLGMRDV